MAILTAALAVVPALGQRTYASDLDRDNKLETSSASRRQTTLDLDALLGWGSNDLLNGELSLSILDGFGPTGFTLQIGAGDPVDIDLGGLVTAAGLTLGIQGQAAEQDIVVGESARKWEYRRIDKEGVTAHRGVIGQAGWGYLYLGRNGWLDLHHLELGKARFAGGHLQIDGGEVRVLRDATIGFNGYGNVTVANGGLLEVAPSTERGETVLGLNPNAYGRLQVTGQGSRAELGDIVIGQKGRGRLDILNGGYVQTRGNATIGGNSSANVRDQGSTWEITGTLNARDGSLLSLANGGIIAVQGQALFDTGSIIRSTGSLTETVANKLSAAGIINEGRMDVRSNLILATPLFTNGGIISIGDGSQTADVKLKVTGDLIQSGTGIIQMTLQRSGDRVYETLLEIDGQLLAAGIFKLDVNNIYLAAGETFSLIQVHGDRAGDFFTKLIVNNGNHQVDLSWQGTTLVAHVVPEPSTWILMGLGFGGILYYVRKRKLL